ncbi:P-loop containing nucleoside triphosphate hydrolase protein [Crassisporium funariophilum]|nr:P-loop containing nucleoside triphosphate hydrolase protein [Crassisporium funariophilum]
MDNDRALLNDFSRSSTCISLSKALKSGQVVAQVPFSVVNTALADVPAEKRPCLDKDLVRFENKLAERWVFHLREYQLKGIIAQLKQQDVLIHAGTGMGKTAVAAGPHLHASLLGKVTIMVLPLIALHDEMSETFPNEFNLSAMSVNSSDGGCAPDKLRKIVAGKWQIILISPEQLPTRQFIQQVLKDLQFKQKLCLVVTDEAHVILHWGSGFRKKYGELGFLQSFILKLTSIVALSATMPQRIHCDILAIGYSLKSFRVKVGIPAPVVLKALHEWRVSIKKQDCANALLPVCLVDLLASVGPVTTRTRLSTILAGQWGWEATYGNELFKSMSAMNIPQMLCVPARC